MRPQILGFANDNSEMRDYAAAYVYGAFNWPSWMPKEPPQALVQSVTTLAGDGQPRTATLPASEYPPGFVVDKGFSVSIFESGKLSEADYANSIPQGLAPNYLAFEEDYPAMLQWWTRIESNLERGQKLDIEDTANAMYDGLHCFVLAATLEIYEPMAS